MKAGSRSCRVMLNYRLISVSATTLYIFIRIHVESFNIVYEPRFSDLANACAVFVYHRGQGTRFFQDWAHILVYMMSYCISVVYKL